MPGLSAPVSMGAGRCESWEDGGENVRGDDESSSEARKFKFAVTVSCQHIDTTDFTWKY